MSEVLHVLRKDLRHLWPLIGCVALSCLFTLWMYVRTFSPVRPDPSQRGWDKLLIFTPDFGICLIVVASWLLVTRLFLEEPFVDRHHFWLTRPYSRPLLLVERAVFVLLTISLPFLLMQCAILRFRGLEVLPALPDIVLNVGMLTLFLLPFAAIAVFTRTLSKCLLITLGIIILGALLLLLVWELFPPDPNPSFGTYIFLCVDAVLLAAFILIQTLTRQVMLARFLLALVPCSFILMMIPRTNLSMALVYPPTDIEKAGVKMSLDTPRIRRAQDLPAASNDEVVLAFPLKLQGIGEGEEVNEDGIRLTLHGRDGFQWQSNWAFIHYRFNGPLDGNISMPVTVFRQISNQPMAADVELAVKVTVLGPSHDIMIGPSERIFPGMGICSVSVKDLLGISCANPVFEPRAHLLEARVSEACDASQPPQIERAYLGSADKRTLPANFSALSTDSAGFSLVPSGANPDWEIVAGHRAPPKNYQICPGTPLSVRRIFLKEQKTIKAHADSILVKDYAITRVDGITPP